MAVGVFSQLPDVLKYEALTDEIYQKIYQSDE